MMGPRQVAQGALFCEFTVEDHVPSDHLLRSIDRFAEPGDMRRHLAPFYSSTGRLSVDPDADCWLRLRPPVRAAALRGGSPEPRLPRVPPI